MRQRVGFAGGVITLLLVSCVQERRSRLPGGLMVETAPHSSWSSHPSPTRGAESATGPRPLNQPSEADLQEVGRQAMEWEDEGPTLEDLGLAVPERTFDWNLIRHADGTLTKVYYFRSGKPGAEVYVDLLKSFVPGFAGLEAGVDYHHELQYTRDTRPANADVWRGGGATPLPTGAADAMDLLMVTATESTLRQVDLFLESVIARVPQVELEVTIVEIGLDDELKFGLQATIDRGTEEDPESGLVDQVVVGLAQDLVDGTFGSFSAIQDESVVNGLLELLQTMTYSNVLSSPKLAVLNGHRAVIDTGSETPTFTPKFNASGLTSIATSFEPTGIKVIVVPFILDDDTIQLEISVESSAVTGFVTAGIGSDAEIENPLIAQRTAYTVVNVPSGKSVLIGGLVTTDEIDLVDKVPVLGDLPLIGFLFKRTTTTRRRAQVLFLVEPTLDKSLSRADVYDDPSEALRE